MDIEVNELTRVNEKKVVGTQINLSTYNELKEIAKEDFMSISDLLRKIIVLYLRDNAKFNDERSDS